MITINRIKNIAKDIIADDEWVNDSHSGAEHQGVRMGLEMLVKHLEETGEGDAWKDTDKKLIDGYWYVKMSDLNLVRSK